jgi:hypothetical protein
MGVGQGHQQPVAAQNLEHYPGGFDGRAQQREVDLSGQQRGDLRRGQHLPADAHVDAGEGFAQSAHKLRQQRVRRRADAPDGQPALRTVRDALRLLGGVVDRAQDLHRPLQICLTGRRQLDLSRASHEQRDAQLGLELSDLLRQRRLRDV